MEGALRKSGHGDVAAKEEKRVESINGDEEGCKNDDNIVLKVPSITSKMERSSAEPNSRASSSTQKDQDGQIESAKAEMGEVREENQRLRMYLDQIMKDYKNLQMQFHGIVQQEAKRSTNTANTHQETEERELVSLTLGRTSSDAAEKDEIYRIPSKGKGVEKDKEGLALRLDSKFEVSKNGSILEPSLNLSPENSLEEVKELEAKDSWAPHKIPKTMRSGDDDVSQQNPVKKARVSVRARCDTPTMNDGCQWRKYGQKTSKGNPCPRAYYRCTISPSCPVRKQVQRFAEDMSILTTTYEGTHNHPLPMSATAMASTTSAAASMLMSGSSSSAPGPNPSAGIDLHGLNLYLSDNSKQFYLPNSSYSPSPSCPTITLDLTSSSSSSFSSSHFSKIPSNFPPKYSSTNFNFSSLESNPLPLSWSNGVLNYGNSTTQPNNKNQIGFLDFESQPLPNIYQSYTQRTNPNSQQSLPPDTIAAATKAITSDPSFRSALAIALTSIIGADRGSGDKFGQNLKLSEAFPAVTNLPSTPEAANTCSLSYLNILPSTTKSQPGSLAFLQSSFPFSSSKSKPTSPGEDRDHIVI